MSPEAEPASPEALASGIGVPGPRGFLPAYEPLERLPHRFAPWEELVSDLPARRLVGRIRDDLAALPLLDPRTLDDGPEAERAMLVLSFLAGSHVHATDPPALSLPPPVARPLVTLARRLGRPPIAAHASLAMHNWRRLDPEGPLVLENLATLVRAHGSTDEIWFFTVAIAIEGRGAAVPALVVGALAAAEAEKVDAVGRALADLEQVIRSVTRLTERTRENCDPRVFYHRVRPPFSAWPAPGVRYEGTDLARPLRLAGGSAAQSPLIQTFDAALGVRHPPAARRLHLEMRRYMAPAHRRFISAVEADGAVRRLVLRVPDPALRDAYDGALAALLELRRVHWKLVVDYISKQAAPGTVARGTGGTDYGRFLAAARDGVERSAVSG